MGCIIKTFLREMNFCTLKARLHARCLLPAIYLYFTSVNLLLTPDPSVIGILRSHFELRDTHKFYGFSFFLFNLIMKKIPAAEYNIFQLKFSLRGSIN